METRANYVIVGIFTLVAIVAAFAFVYWAAAIGDRGAARIFADGGHSSFHKKKPLALTAEREQS